MAIRQRNRAAKTKYLSQHQLVLEGFETPFIQKLIATNRWVLLAQQIPWDILVGVYNERMQNKQTGAAGINPRVALGAVIIKHMENLSDRDTLLHIQENMYMQYFIGYSSYSNVPPFDPSLFVEIRTRLGVDQINMINEQIIQLIGRHGEQNVDEVNEQSTSSEAIHQEPEVKISETAESEDVAPSTQTTRYDEDSGKQEVSAINNEIQKKEPAPYGKMISDATACPQDIAYPTDLNLLNESREQSEGIIDTLYLLSRKDSDKPRTYRKKARKDYLKTAQKRSKTNKEIRQALRKQLCYVGRNIKTIHKLLDEHDRIPLNKFQLKYLFVIQTLYDQQLEMYQNNVHSVAHRITNIHQPHVRPIVRGKTTAKVEFGAKIQVSIMQGYTVLDEISWDPFNEGTRLMNSVEHHRKNFGYYPKEVLVDKIYCTRSNRNQLKEKGIQLLAKPLGRPKAVPNHISPGARNPIEGKFGQAKTAYGMNRIKARLKNTSESWIASIILVLNLVKLAGEVPYCLCRTFVKWILNQIDDIILLTDDLNRKISY